AILRYDFEKEILADTLQVKDLPEAWSARFRSDLGLEPKNHAEGVLQDPHWFDQGFLSFPSYVLGNLISAQIYGAIVKRHPDLEDHFARGDFFPLKNDLTQNI